MPQSDRFFRENHVAIQRLYNRFRSFGDITYESIRDWIDQFDRRDGALAIRILEKVFFVDQSKILTAYQSIHQQLASLEDDLLKVFFAGYGYAGSSGEGMLYRYKTANRLRGTQIEANFMNMTDIPSRLLFINAPSVLFVDDFVGSGNGAIKVWRGETGEESPALQDIVPASVRNRYLGVAVAYQRGIDEIQASIPLTVLPWKIFSERERVLSERSSIFNRSEKELIRMYCRRTGCSSSFETGYGDTQSLVVFEHNCPNDSLPILWFEGNDWKALFARR